MEKLNYKVMYMRSTVLSLLCMLFIGSGTLIGSQGPITHVVLDLGGLLVETNKSAAFKEVGYTPFLAFAASNIMRIFVLKKIIHEELLYPFLGSLEARNPLQVAARDPEGKLIPQIMCTHFKGTISDAGVRTKIEHALTVYTNLNRIEKNMLRALTSMMFTPERFIKTQYIVPEGKKFVESCVEHGLKPCIHSTWARESFELLKQQEAEFFALFEDRIFISGRTGLMKPDPDSFTNITVTLQIPAWACAFFDDRIENISTARGCGMHAWLITQTCSWSQPWKWIPDFDTACAYLAELRINVAPAIAL